MTIDTEVNWLSPIEEKAWRGWVEVTQRISAAIERDLRSDADLNRDDYEVLVRLSEAEDHSLRMSDLAAGTIQSASRLSQRVDRLSERGYLERRRCEEDGRGFFAVLTDEGFAALEAAAPGHVESVRRNLFRHLTPGDVATLAELMPRIATSYNSTERPAAR